MGRIIFVHQTKGTKQAWPVRDSYKQVMAKKLVADLQHISTLHGAFDVTDEAKQFVEQWYQDFDPEVGTRMSGYYERKQSHMLKLAMIMSAAFDDSLTIDTHHCKLALAMLDVTETWIPEALALVGATLEARVEDRIVTMLKSKGEPVREGELLKLVRKDIRGKREFNSIMNTLRMTGDVLKSGESKKDGHIYYIMTSDYPAWKKRSGNAKEEATPKAEV